MMSALMSPIVAHQVARPLGLVHRAQWRELDHERLDVEDGRAIHRIQTAYPQLETVDVDQLTPAHADAVGPALGPLAEDADLGPVGVPTWPAGPTGHFSLVDEMEQIHDLDMGEVLETQRGV